MADAQSHVDNTDGAEFVRLLTLYQPNIYLYIRSLVLNPDEAAEVLQETNLVLWEKRSQFEPNTNFLAWAFQIARFKLKQQRDQHNRKCPLFSDELVDELAVQSLRYGNENTELIDELRRCLARLTVRDRELVNHRYSSQATCESIAAVVERPIRWVYNALARIREELLDCMTRSSDVERRKRS